MLLQLLFGNDASVVAIVGELSSSSTVDFSFESDKLFVNKRIENNSSFLHHYLQSSGKEFTVDSDGFDL